MGLLNLEPMDFVYAALLSFMIYFMVKWLWAISGNSLKKAESNIYAKIEKSGALDKCCELFPMEEMVFGGISYSKGQRLIIKTLSHRVLDGVFIGKDEHDRVCVVTDRYVIVHNLDEIFQIDSADKK